MEHSVVMRNVLKGGICVETVELDEPMHGFSFETQVSPRGNGTRRYKTRREAVKGHLEYLRRWSDKSALLNNERQWARKAQRAGVIKHIFGYAEVV